MESKPDNDELPAAGEQALWDLLGRHRPVDVSPYFVRRVLRDLDAGEPVSFGEAAAGWRAWLWNAWILGGSTAALAVVAGVLSFASLTGLTSHSLPATVQRQVESSVVLAAPVRPISPAVPVPDVPAAPAVAAVAGNGGDIAVTDLGEDVSPQDVDVIADLDNLVAREETSVWTDDTSRF